MVISEILQKAYRDFKFHEEMMLDFELLLAHSLGVSREWLFANRGSEVESTEERLFWKYVERRAKGESVAYIVGEKEFYGLNFYVDERVLVPRPETEMIVEKVLEYIRRKRETRCRVLDVGTGSGCIAVAIARILLDERIEVEVDALDLSEEALQVARLNCETHGVEDRVNLFQSDLLEAVTRDEKYDIITVNLPYIGEDDSFVEEGVKKFEPSIALFGGKRGFELYKKMFQELVEKNIEFELMIGEFGFDQGKVMEELLGKYFEQKGVIGRDLAGQNRIFIIKK